MHCHSLPPESLKTRDHIDAKFKNNSTVQNSSFILFLRFMQEFHIPNILVTVKIFVATLLFRAAVETEVSKVHITAICDMVSQKLAKNDC